MRRGAQRGTRRAAGIAAAWLAALGTLACQQEAPESTLRIATVATRDIVVSASAAGAIEPITTVEVKSQASGEIIEVLVEDGDQVTRGQLLARVDARIPRNAVLQAEADSVVARATLVNAESRLERANNLHAAQAITVEELESARLTRAGAYASMIRTERALEDARTALEQTEVRAPSNGVILGRMVEVGSVIASASRDVGGGAVLFRMATLETVQVNALVDETDIGMIRSGMPVTITVAAYPNRPFTGQVLRIGAEGVAQQNVTMFPVIVRIANRERLLKPGMNAEVEIHIGRVEGAVAVLNAALRDPADIAPAAALLGLTEQQTALQLDDFESLPTEDPNDDGEGGRGGRGGRNGRDEVRAPDPTLGGEYVVFAVRNGEFRVVLVRTGLTDFDYSAVLDGLAPGDSVVILPTAGLLSEQAERQEWIERRVGGNPLTGGGGGRGGRGGGGD